LSGGIWLALIGFFLRNAAVQHVAGQALTEELAGAHVNDLMRTRGAWVAASTPASELPRLFIQNDQRGLPVFEGTTFVGVVGLEELRRAAHTPNPYASARDVMTARARLTVTTPDTDVVDALRALGRARTSELAVMVGETLVGMLFERDIARWLELRAGSDTGMRPPRHRHA